VIAPHPEKPQIARRSHGLTQIEPDEDTEWARAAARAWHPFRREKVPGHRSGRALKESGSAARL